jgi:hypothetical protein
MRAPRSEKCNAIVRDMCAEAAAGRPLTWLPALRRRHLVGRIRSRSVAVGGEGAERALRAEIVDDRSPKTPPRVLATMKVASRSSAAAAARNRCHIRLAARLIAARMRL